MSLINPKDLPKENCKLIIDVRTPEEFSQCHIPGSKNIPLDTLTKELEEIKNQKEIILSCKIGGRAQRAKDILESFGCTNVKVLEGGIKGWINCNLPTEPNKKG